MRNGDMPTQGVSPFFMGHIAAFAPRYRRTRAAVQVSTGAGTGKHGRGYGWITKKIFAIFANTKEKP